jgi:Na+-transporting methylmalonyl-CoA/oxaloacetate decarboxylase gamma subunit
MLGRVFGVKDVLENIAFVSASIGAGALLAVLGVRVVFVGAGLLTVAMAMFGALSFRAAGSAAPALAPSE